jgi:hypothetical protein
METPKRLRRHLCLIPIAILFETLSLPASAADASGHYEVYCDGVGIFLANIDGTPAPRKLALFSGMDFPPGTMGDSYIGQGKWSDVVVLPNGCVPDGKCEGIARGKIWIDVWDAPGAGDPPPKRISGKYEIDLNGKHLEGQFAVKRRIPNRAERVCM